MKASLLTCGLAVALVGCSGVDHGYPPSQSRGPMLSDRTMPVPPPTAPTWQQYNRGSQSAYRNPSDSLIPGGSFGTTPQAGAMTAAGSTPVADPLRTAQAMPPPSPYGGSVAANPPGSPSLPADSTQRDSWPGEIGTPSIQRVSYEQPVQPPLRGVAPDTLPRTENPRSAVSPRLLADATTPLLMAVPERVEKPAGDPAKSTTPAVEETPKVMPAMPVQPLAGSPKIEEKDQPPTSPMSPMPAAAGCKTPEEKGSGAQAAPTWRMVNSKRIVLNYELKDVGPSGVSAVEMWYTRDGQKWQKDEATGHSGPPYVIEVPEEGQYGFTMVARNGIGLGKEPPKSGDLPQVWVQVDMTRPTVKLLDVAHGKGTKAREVTILWEAHDRNMARRPITLSFATAPEGPWLPFAANIENSGHHTWNMPQSGPVSFYTRVEAVDMVGNVGSDQSVKATSIDTSHPTVSILGVETGEK